MFADAELLSYMSVVVLVADGARFDAFEGGMRDLPALRRLRDEGGLHAITTVFPSVTGPAYAPFLLGRFPGAVGVPGIRWYDRSRTRGRWPDYARSYVGVQFSQFDGDLDVTAPTIFELVPHSIGALSVVTRGLAPSRRHGTLTAKSALRVGLTHFRGRAEGWLDIDREVLDTIPRRIRDDRPDFVFAALAGVDKTSHARGHESPAVREALAIVDATAAQIRADAERGGYWDEMQLWVVSDHGHSAVHSHEDLAGLVASTGARTVAHPWAIGVSPEVAVMVSGNAMAHLYLEPRRRERPWWGALEARWSPLAELLLARESVDLLLLPRSASECEVRSGTRGSAVVIHEGESYRYLRTSGDPLDYGADVTGSANETHDATCASTYPDALVQVASLAASSRAGDVILSAAPGWDFRARYEPIPHASAHGSLHRDHMRVPLLTNRPVGRTPRRTTDVFASALAALRIRPPARMDGESFLRDAVTGR